MSTTPSAADSTIVGKITPWFTRRMLMMFALFAGFSAFFMYDWKVGYPKKRVIYDTYLEYEADWKKMDAAGDRAGVDAKRQEWAKLSEEKGWDLNLKTLEPESKIDDGKIAEQLYCGIGTGVFALGILIYMLVNMRKTLKVDDQGVTLPNGKKVPYADIHKVDSRRWGNKGLATIHFSDGGSKSSAKIDGLKYGGFIKPEPYTADLILNRIIESFEGDVIELEIEEETETSDDGGIKDA